MNSHVSPIFVFVFVVVTHTPNPPPRLSVLDVYSVKELCVLAVS